jgi:hypothetical protein
LPDKITGVGNGVKVAVGLGVSVGLGVLVSDGIELKVNVCEGKFNVSDTAVCVNCTVGPHEISRQNVITMTSSFFFFIFPPPMNDYIIALLSEKRMHWRNALEKCFSLKNALG